jgi:hypothetical protein
MATWGKEEEEERGGEAYRGWGAGGRDGVEG